MKESFRNLIELIEYRAEHSSEKMCCTFHEFPEKKLESSTVSFTYSKLYTIAKGIAAQIMQRTEKDDRVLILASPGTEIIGMLWGCFLSGRIAVLLYPPLSRYAAWALENTLKDSSPSLVLIEKELSKHLKKLKWFGGLIALGTFRRNISKDLNVSGDVIRRSELWRIPSIVYSEEEACDASGFGKMPTISEEQIAYLQYTSGSAGKPKGVMISHKNLITNLGYIAECFQSTEESVWVSWLPPYHDQGLVGGILSPMWWNTSTHLFSGRQFIEKPVRWLKLISEVNAAVSGAPNFAYEVCLRKIREEEKKELNLESWKFAFNGAEPVRADTLYRFTEAFNNCGFDERHFLPCYGMAETTLFVSGSSFRKEKMLLEVDNDAFEKQQVIKEKNSSKDSVSLVSSGIPYCELLIVDPKTLIPLKEKEIGEIILHDDSITKGYWNHPEITAEATVTVNTEKGSRTFFRTGDLGFLKEGFLFITGRRNDLIIIQGRNIYPQEIENSVTSLHKECRKGCCAAFSIYKSLKDQIVIVAEIYKETSEEEYKNLMLTIRDSIGDTFNIPVYDVLLLAPKSLPKTLSGKLRRVPTKEAYLENKLPALAALKNRVR